MLILFSGRIRLWLLPHCDRMMDLWAVHVKNTTGSPFCLRNHSVREKSFSFGKFRVLDVRVLKRKVFLLLGIILWVSKLWLRRIAMITQIPLLLLLILLVCFFFKIHNIELLFWLNFVYLLMILCDYIFVLNKEVIEIELIKRNRLLLM
jgi:hypothetical protein